MVLGQLAQPFKKAWLRSDDSHVARNRLDDHAGHLVRAGLEDGAYRLQVVVRYGHRESREHGGHAGAVGLAQSEHTRSRSHEQGVGVAVVATIELEDYVTPSGGAGEPERAHRGFGARADETHHLHRGHSLHDERREVSFGGDRCAVAGAPGNGVGKRLNDVRVSVPGDEGAP